MPSAQRIVDHLAYFHDASRVGPELTVDADAENDVFVLEPRGVFRTARFGVVGRGNAIAGFSGLVIGAVVDQDAAPRDVPPVDIACDEDFVPAGDERCEYGALES